MEIGEGQGTRREGVEGWRGAVMVSSAMGTVRGVNTGLTVILVEGLRGTLVMMKEFVVAKRDQWEVGTRKGRWEQRDCFEGSERALRAGS
jgi:hypothetical protein